MTDDLTRAARLFRAEAVAALVAVLRSDKALPNAKTQAATKLLELSDGKPQPAKMVSLADLDKLGQEDRVALLYDLMQRCESETGILQAMMRDAVMQVADNHQITAKFGFRRGDAQLALPAPTTLTAQNSTSKQNELEVLLPRHPSSGPPSFADVRAAQPIVLEAELPPPRSPQHSPINTKPTHYPNGRPIQRIGDAPPEPEVTDPNQDHWTRILNGYNTRWRNGH
jgi:hypothetical protein